jgi:N utilization substance protein B
MQKGTHRNRTLARRKAVQIIYSALITGEPLQDAIEQGVFVDEVGVPCDFTKMLVAGVAAHLDEIDALVASTSQNWSIERMPLVDRGILRMAVFEMKYVDEVPTSVSINEAVELARNFGGEDDSSRFVNGVLGKIATILTTKQTVELEQ